MAARDTTDEPILFDVEPRRRPPGATAAWVRRGAVQIRVASWDGSDADRGTVFLLHGYSEYIEKYYDVIADLLARGFGVVSFDWRGQGLSTRMLPANASDQRFHQRAYVEDYGHMLADADAVFRQHVADRPGPKVLLGHSMGAHMSLRMVQDFPDRFDHAVAIAPMLGFVGGPPMWAMKMAARAAVIAGKGSTYAMGYGDHDRANPLNRVTTDIDRFDAGMAYWEAHPELEVGGVTYRWVREALASVELINQPERIKAIRTPTLIACAGNDLLVDIESQRRFASLSDRVTFELFEDAMHEILQEVDLIRNRFWDSFDEFVGVTS